MVHYEISHPQLLEIRDGTYAETTFGPDQVWYPDRWLRKSGCGPTSASLLMAYYAFTRPELRSLYIADDLTRHSFIRQMQEMSRFIKPGMMGVDKISKYVDGVIQFADEKGITLSPHVFEVGEKNDARRNELQGLADFVSKGLSSDSPLGFLVLSRGNEKHLQNWHWITVTGADITEDTIRATASDEGKKKTFDLSLWYHTTSMNGGLVYFTA